MARSLLLACCLALVACVPRAPASPLRALFDGEAGGPLVRVATNDRAGKNNDFISVAPGQSATLMDVQGPGLVRHVWMTIKPRARIDVLRGLVLRVYWDGETTPSVEAPIGDFFAVGFGERAEVSSLLVAQTSGGLNCFWPMPFRRRAVWTVANYSATKIDSLYFHADVSRPASLPADTPYFHAHWRRARTAGENPYLILDTRGAGHYVGTVLSMQNLSHRSLLFLEGNEAFWIDDEPQPSIVGTGTEDYFLGGWYFDRGAFSAWSHGATIVDPGRGRVSAFRWHVADRIPYQKRLRVTIEDGLMFVGKPNSDYSSVAFYYQLEPHSVGSSISRYADVEPTPITPPPPARPGTREAEAAAADIRVSAGFIQVEQFGYIDGPSFSGNSYVAWAGAAMGAEMTMPFTVAEGGTRDVQLLLGRAADGVIAEVWLDDKRVATVDFFQAGVTFPVAVYGPVSVGRHELAKGAHRLRLKVTGVNPSVSTSDRFLYLDGLSLEALPGNPRPGG